MPPVHQIARGIATEGDTDVYFYNGPIRRGSDLNVVQKISRSKSQPHALVLLTTAGGDAHAAYKIARHVQNLYSDFTVLVSGICKSAGTLIAVGANSVAFSPYGELGPLDIQAVKTDNLAERQSGLTITESLDHLTRSALGMHGRVFSRIMADTEAVISFKTAAQAASELVTGLYAPMLSQIDPIEVGDKARSMRIASDYGRRLDAHSQNLRDNALDALTETYPAHGFVIDMQEARRLFKKVRPLTSDETALIALLGVKARFPNPDDETVFQCLSQAPDSEERNDVPTDGPGSTEGNRENTETTVEATGSSEQHDVAGGEKHSSV